MTEVVAMGKKNYWGTYYTELFVLDPEAHWLVGARPEGEPCNSLGEVSRARHIAGPWNGSPR